LLLAARVEKHDFAFRQFWMTDAVPAWVDKGAKAVELITMTSLRSLTFFNFLIFLLQRILWQVTNTIPAALAILENFQFLQLLRMALRRR